MTGPNAAIAIICKVPKAGSSKTRFIPTLGPDAAAALSRAFLIDLAATVEEVARDLGASGYAVSSPADAAADLATFLPATFGCAIDASPIPGAVLDAGTEDLLARGHDCVLLVNGDSPTLPASILRASIWRCDSARNAPSSRRPSTAAMSSWACGGGVQPCSTTFRGARRPSWRARSTGRGRSGCRPQWSILSMT